MGVAGVVDVVGVAVVVSFPGLAVEVVVVESSLESSDSLSQVSDESGSQICVQGLPSAAAVIWQ